jgi:hypothetical protein
MAYLRLQDYYNLTIQQSQLAQITQNNDSVRISCELVAQAEMISYLVQRYDIEDEFTDIATYSYGQTYLANQLVQLDGSDYVATNTYALHSICVNSGLVYICTTAITTPEAFNASHWMLLGSQYDLWSVASPFPRYSYKTNYAKGDVAFYKNNLYICQSPNINIMPTDLNVGEYYWGVKIPYSFSGVEPYNVPTDFGSYASGTTYTNGQIVNYNGSIYVSKSTNIGVNPDSDCSKWQVVIWQNKDNRSIQLVSFLLDIVLYKIHMRIAPNNIPQLRKDNYNYAIQWLMEAGGQNNAVTADIPLLQPKQGGRIRWGSNVKNYNNY